VSGRDEFSGIVPDRSMQNRFMCVRCGSVRVELRILRREGDEIEVQLYCANCNNFANAVVTIAEVKNGG